MFAGLLNEFAYHAHGTADMHVVRVRNLEYESTAMNNFMRLVKHCTHVLIVGAHCVDWSCKFANSDVMKIFRFRSNFGRETFQGSHVSLSYT